MKLANNIKKHHKHIIIVIVIVLVLASAGITAAILYTKNNSTSSQSSTQKKSQTQSSSESSSNSTSQNKTNDMPTTSTSNTSIVVVDASQYSDVFEVRSYVTAISDGTCTYTFTKDSATITKTSDAVAGPSSTTCKTLDVPISEFTSSGTWSMTISYQSSDSQYSASTQSDIEVK